MSLAFGSKSLVFALDSKSLDLALDGHALALEVVLDVGFELSTSSPSTHFHSHKYLDFIRKQSCSAGSVDSWKSVQQEVDFRVFHHLLEKIFCSPATLAPVETAFRHFGLFVRPHHARMGDRMHNRPCDP